MPEPSLFEQFTRGFFKMLCFGAILWTTIAMAMAFIQDMVHKKKWSSNEIMGVAAIPAVLWAFYWILS